MTFARTVTIPKVEGLHETQAALLVEIDCDEIWIPLSQIDDRSEVQAAGDYGGLMISAWLARQRDLQDVVEQRRKQPRAPVLTNASKVYRELALKYHPDRNRTAGAVRFMQDINALWNAIKRDVNGGR